LAGVQTLPTFEQQLAIGKVAESAIANWLKRMGYSILPVYEKALGEFKGPQLFTPNQSLVAPDMFVFRGKASLWVEAKHKDAFTWHRITQRWVTGIDLRHYIDYCEVDDRSPFPVWLMFLHRGGQAKDSPANSPTGLFAGALKHLRMHENHRHSGWGNSGMVYWSVDTLQKIATLDEVMR